MGDMKESLCEREGGDALYEPCTYGKKKKEAEVVIALILCYGHFPPLASMARVSHTFSHLVILI